MATHVLYIWSKSHALIICSLVISVLYSLFAFGFVLGLVRVFLRVVVISFQGQHKTRSSELPQRQAGEGKPSGSSQQTGWGNNEYW